jgi:hypothetical protein
MKAPNQIRAEHKALQVLERFGLQDARFDPEDLAFVLGLDVEFGGLVHADAWLIRHPDGTGVIRVRDNAHPGRTRFSIAHEIGHWELHPFCRQGFLVCTPADIADYGRSPEEAEANFFAAALLMPKPLIAAGLLKRDPNFKMIEEMAREFAVTRIAAARRLVDLSKQPVVLVSSSSREVNWCVRSASARSVFIAPGSPVPQHSVTEECVVRGTTASEPELVDPATWFPDLQVSDEFELFEQVRYSPAYDTALTMLWLPGLG